MINSLIKDVATLSTLPEESISKLCDYANYCICDCVEESLSNNENISVIDIGIGTLSILIEDNSIKYKFIPSEILEDSIIKTIQDETNSFKFKLEKTLINKLTSLYKELL